MRSLRAAPTTIGPTTKRRRAPRRTRTLSVMGLGGEANVSMRVIQNVKDYSWQTVTVLV